VIYLPGTFALTAKTLAASPAQRWLSLAALFAAKYRNPLGGLSENLMFCRASLNKRTGSGKSYPLARNVTRNMQPVTCNL
jgi:hypothetical protein